MENTEKEKWVQAPGYPRYEISTLGRIISHTGKKPKLLQPLTNRYGYLVVHLTPGTKRGGEVSKLVHVHKLMAEAFIPIPDRLSAYTASELQVDHIIPISDGGKCELNNLRWVTPRENATINEYTVAKRRKVIEQVSKQVYQYETSPILKLVATYPSTADAGRVLNLSQGNIASCCGGSLPRYMGFIFSYTPITSLEEREAVEEAAKGQLKRNKHSTLEAIKRYYKRQKEKGTAWYQRNPDKVKERSQKYYYAHREELLKKNAERRQKQRQQRLLLSKKILLEKQGEDIKPSSGKTEQ